MSTDNTIELLKRKTSELQIRRKGLLEKLAACDSEVNDVAAALRVVEKLNTPVVQPKREIEANQNNPTNGQSILSALKKFGPLTTPELLEKVNELRPSPTTQLTVGVTASRLKAKGEI